MEKSKNFERVYSVSSLVGRLSCKWRNILICAIVSFVIGIVANTVYYKIDVGNTTDNNENTIIDDDKTETSFDFARAYQSEYNHIIESLISQHDYYENSVMGRLNPVATPVAEITFYVVPKEVNEKYTTSNAKDVTSEFSNEKTIINIIGNYVHYGVDWKKLSSERGIKKESYLNDAVYTIIQEGAMKVTVLYFSEQEASELLSEISESITDYFSSVSKNYDEKYMLYNSDIYTTTRVDPQLLNWQIGMMNRITSYQTAKTQAESQINSNEQLTTTKSNKKSQPVSYKKIIKEGVKVSMLCTFLYVMFELGYLLFGNYIFSGKEFGLNFDLIDFCIAYSNKDVKNKRIIDLFCEDVLYDNINDVVNALVLVIKKHDSINNEIILLSDHKNPNLEKISKIINEEKNGITTKVVYPLEDNSNLIDLVSNKATIYCPSIGVSKYGFYKKQALESNYNKSNAIGVLTFYN